MNNVLDLADHAMFLAQRSPVANLMQCVWVYDRAIDLDGLARFHRRLAHGRLSRRIERSPLPFGRHRWVAASGHSSLEIVETPRPRAEFDIWLDEQTTAPLDCERGPEWHLAVLPFTDGGAGVSLVISHCLSDGVGLSQALADAACGRDDPIRWPAPSSRPWWRAVTEDARQTARDALDIGRAVVAATTSGPHRPRGAGAPGERIRIPKEMIFVDADEWDARADSLGGTSNALLAALAARLAQRLGRVGPDLSVTVNIPVNERVPGDTRANAVSSVDITVDPTLAPTDLRQIRAATKQALIRHPHEPDERWPLLPLVPVAPRALVADMLGVGARGAGVISSNVGAVQPAASRVDGTDADYFAMKTLYPNVTGELVHRAGGLLSLLSGRVNGRIFVSILAYHPGRENSDVALRQVISRALSDLRLTAVTDWGGNARQLPRSEHNAQNTANVAFAV